MGSILVYNRVIEKETLEIIKDVKDNIFNGKLEKIIDRGDEIQVTCPVHNFGKESRPSCFIKSENGIWHCFTCSSSGTLAKFVGECFDKSEDFGANWLINHYGGDFVQKEINLPEIDLGKKEVKFYNESILDKFESYHPYMTKRKLTSDVIKKYKIKYDPKNKSIIFPT